VRTIRVAWTGAGAPSYSNDVAFPAYRIATGDFTGDGNDDVAGLVRETISGQYLVSVLPGDGGNGFSTEIRSPATLDQDDNLSPIAAGDLNRDGILDLVTGRGAHLGLGDGHFGTLIAFETPPSVDYKDLLLTDLDWDGILDVVGGVSSGPTVTARLGRGDGSFLFRSILTGYPYTPLAAGDLDGDGYAELALGCAPTYVFRGNSNAVFNLEGVYGGTFNAVAFADANGDGVRDILSTHSYLPNLKPIVDTYPPVAHVGHPNGGKLVAAEQPVTIDWTSKDGVGVQKVDLYLVREPGGQVVPIQEGLPTNGTLEWTPGMANAGLAKIRVVATDLSGNQAMDESDAAFPIAMPPVGVPDTTVANLKLALRVSPNPFKGRGRVELDLPGPTPVRMTVHDVSGRLVEVLEDEFVATARHSQEWRASGFAPGVYFVRLDTRFGALTKRIVLFP
jgi:hypothetical protein